jgi:putative transposase
LSTFTQIYYHIIFSTKNREPVLKNEKKQELFRYIWGIIKNKNCYLYRINGVKDHIHILTSLHPSICLADLIKLLKTSTSKWIKENSLFPDFTFWQEGYGAFTVSPNEKDNIIQYIINQEEHHKNISFADELKSILDKLNIPYDPKYLL